MAIVREVELGRSGVRVSRVVFGAMAHGTGADEAQRIATLRAAIAAGITSIDTAPLYDFGACEQLVGRAVMGLRERVQLLTKVGLRWDDPHGQVLFRFHDAQGREQAVRRNSRPDSIRLEVERSLQRLATDVLDLVQIHQPDPDTPIADSIGALLQLRAEGKLRAIGVSNFSAAQMAQAQAALGVVPLASNQVHYSLLERWPEVDVLPHARAQAIGVLAYSPLAQGLLAGGTQRAAFTAGDGRGSDPRFHPDNRARVQAAIDRAVVPIAHAHGASVAQVALAWLLAQPGLSAVIVGASSAEQVRANAAAAELVLGSDELRAIGNAFARLKLDASAGLSSARRAAQGLRRVAGAVRRRLPLPR
jgi:aryl-alcohol dehydrogenase-like predicted oxidoreductase